MTGEDRASDAAASPRPKTRPMKAIAIVNPKGGSGKSTLATNLAGFLAWHTPGVMLGDVDRQQSCRGWLSLRPATLPAIETWQVDADNVARPPKGVWRAVLDTPAGLRGKLLEKVVKASGQILVPIQPSPFDLWAVAAFLDDVQTLKRVHNGKAEIGLVAMRCDARTRAATQLDAFLASRPEPRVATIRPTQLYGAVAAQGMTVFDLPPEKAPREREDWQPLLDWLDLG